MIIILSLVKWLCTKWLYEVTVHTNTIIGEVTVWSDCTYEHYHWWSDCTFEHYHWWSDCMKWLYIRALSLVKWLYIRTLSLVKWLYEVTVHTSTITGEVTVYEVTVRSDCHSLLSHCWSREGTGALVADTDWNRGPSARSAFLTLYHQFGDKWTPPPPSHLPNRLRVCMQHF